MIKHLDSFDKYCELHQILLYYSIYIIINNNILLYQLFLFELMDQLHNYMAQK